MDNLDSPVLLPDMHQLPWEPGERLPATSDEDVNRGIDIVALYDLRSQAENISSNIANKDKELEQAMQCLHSLIEDRIEAWSTLYGSGDRAPSTTGDSFTYGRASRIGTFSQSSFSPQLEPQSQPPTDCATWQIAIHPHDIMKSNWTETHQAFGLTDCEKDIAYQNSTICLANDSEADFQSSSGANPKASSNERDAQCNALYVKRSTRLKRPKRHFDEVD